MHAPFKQKVDNLPAFKELKLVDWLSLLFAIWLLFCVTMPDTVYQAFFHILVYPLTIYLIVNQDNKIIWKDSFIQLFIIFCSYMATTTWLVGNNALSDNIQATRWGVEAFLGIFAYWIWMQSVISHPSLWGKCFLFIAWAGAFAGIVSSITDISVAARIGGLGMMEHPIQGASISIILLATGLFLLHANQKTVNWSDIFCTFIATVTVCIFVTLSQSRAPQATFLGYAVFFGLFISYQYRRPLTFYLVGGVFIGLFLAIHWFVGFELLYEQLKERGTSYRLDIWASVFNHPPESFLLGHGAGLDFRLTDAARVDLNDLEFEVYHPHNIWLGAFMDTGIIGVVMQIGLLMLPLAAILRSPFCIATKIHLIVIIGLFLLLTFTDEYTLLISPHPVWLIGWIPLIFVWTWCRYQREQQNNSL